MGDSVLGKTLLGALYGGIFGVVLGCAMCICLCDGSNTKITIVMCVVVGTIFGLFVGIAERNERKTEYEMALRTQEEAAREIERKKIHDTKILEFDDYKNPQEVKKAVDQISSEFRQDALNGLHYGEQMAIAEMEKVLRKGNGKCKIQSYDKVWLQAFEEIKLSKWAGMMEKDLEDATEKNEADRWALEYIMRKCNSVYATSRDVVWKERSDKAEEQLRHCVNHNHPIVVERGCYGKANRSFEQRIKSMSVDVANERFDEIFSLFESGDVWKRLEINLGEVLEHVWFYAVTRPQDKIRFEKACEIYDFYTSYNADGEREDVIKIMGLNTLLAELYVAKDLGEGVLRQKEEALYKWLEYYLEGRVSEAYENLASGLMWLKAYELEKEVLNRVAASGVAMKGTLQERLRFLENGGDQGYKLKKVAKMNGNMVFDHSSLKWEKEDYFNLFTSLSYANEILEYALTVREWSKNIPISAGMNGTTLDEIFAKVNIAITYEYGDSVKCQKQRCSILAEDVETEIDGILLSPNKDSVGFEHMALLLNVIRVGRNLNIRIYTLFMPCEKNIELQQQQAMTLKKNVNPNVAAFEEGLRESVLHILEEMLNKLPDTEVRVKEPNVTETAEVEKEY